MNDAPRDLWETNASWWIDGFTDGVDAEYEEQILPLAAEEMAGGRRILDIGCGEGQVSRLAKRIGAELVVGVDPTTDLAVLKIEAENLPSLAFANSDEVRLGEWVLAVGNPFNLNSTVTAGIISAKGRSINIIDNQSAIEAFIQTDAVVNPGNSGGALINTRGDLIGINTAISTRTGSYEGYSFAVPANIVRKVVDDLTKYGVVQRAYLGVNIADITPELAKELNIKETQGVYLSDVTEGGAAAEAGHRAKGGRVSSAAMAGRGAAGAGSAEETVDGPVSARICARANSSAGTLSSGCFEEATASWRVRESSA